MGLAKPLTIRVLGLGNLMRTDDAAGMLAVRMVAEDSRLPRDVEVIEGGTLGLDLLHAVYGVSHLLVLDAVDTGAAPGTLIRFEGQELANLPTSKSVHLLGLSDLINVLQLMEAPPMEMVLLGAQPGSTDWGTSLTPAVEECQRDLVEVALAQISAWREENSVSTTLSVPMLAVQ
ncbi:MAG: HyaD/HybD family hydrogenase maturation endopeptidase [Edaphobacter sp.]